MREAVQGSRPAVVPGESIIERVRVDKIRCPGTSSNNEDMIGDDPEMTQRSNREMQIVALVAGRSPNSRSSIHPSVPCDCTPTAHR